MRFITEHARLVHRRGNARVCHCGQQRPALAKADSAHINARERTKRPRSGRLINSRKAEAFSVASAVYDTAADGEGVPEKPVALFYPPVGDQRANAARTHRRAVRIERRQYADAVCAEKAAKVVGRSGGIFAEGKIEAARGGAAMAMSAR